jgi:hypothetical protein
MPSDRKSPVRNWDLRPRGGGGSDVGYGPSAPNYAVPDPSVRLSRKKVRRVRPA